MSSKIYCPSCYRMFYHTLFITDEDLDLECKYCEKIFKIRHWLDQPPPSKL